MESARTEIADWIVRAALDGADEIAVLAGVCERLNALGLSLMRASVANNQLDPTHDARGVRWLREQGGLEEAFERIHGLRFDRKKLQLADAIRTLGLSEVPLQLHAGVTAVLRVEVVKES